jgi:hypothetical protein
MDDICQQCADYNLADGQAPTPSGEHHANGEARQVSQERNPATLAGRSHPDGPSSSSHVLLNVDGSLAVTPGQIRYAQERRSTR